MKTTCTWCCNKCLKLYEVVREEDHIEDPPNKGKCNCGGVLTRGLHPSWRKEIFNETTDV